ncbi:MAG: TetR/AcrR family transcriptional regulator [Calditrichaeota bacterium]|nr:TetR/AcrR family transcriptional regulator [Calditrichota bacterium]
MVIEKADRKENILRVAQALFSRFGLAKTTIEDIARRARMGKASIYYYFRNKEAIFQEVIDKEGRELRQKVLQAIRAERTPQRKIRAYVITRASALKELANYYTAFRDEYLEQYAFIEKARREYNEFEQQVIRDILQEGMDQGVFQIEDVHLTAEAIVAALKGLEYHWTIHVPLETIEKNVDTLLTILFKGIERRD